jgi:alpha-glucosidase (family GH31 glycosyl hydrolase)
MGVWCVGRRVSDWHSLEDGQDLNYRLVEKHRSQGVPLSAMMAEDWYWAFTKFPPIDSWELNRDHYPNYERMIVDQRAAGVRHIGYFLPYFADGFPAADSVFDQGNQAGHFTKKATGDTYLFDFAVWKQAQVDVTNTRAVKWFKDRFYAKAAAWGVDGWMNDFGEYTPHDSVSANGEWGWSMHNRYPLLWAQAAKDFWQAARPDGDYVFFSRSGYTGQQSIVPFHFTGDRNATYERLSGLGGQIPGVLSAGLSAHPNTSLDIGAYNCDGTEPMGKLMMFRWIEMGALIPVMRLHRGLPLCDHWRVDEDEATFAHWKRYAELHVRLFPYIYTLAAQAERHGWPMVRHLALHFPDDRSARDQDYQFLLGDRILVAPVIEEELRAGDRASLARARRTWQVYLPSGNWRHFWSGRKYQGAQIHEVPAAPGELPFFLREGKIVPTYDRQADTLVNGVDDPKIRDFEFVDASMEVLFFGYGADKLELWDGSVVACTRAQGEAGSCSVSGGGKRVYKYSFVD